MQPWGEAEEEEEKEGKEKALPAPPGERMERERALAWEGDFPSSLAH